MIIIIDGPDLSGKTTAINIISKHFNSGFVLKNSFKPKNKQNSYDIYNQYWTIFSMVKELDMLVILDRSFPSQAVYSYLRGQGEMRHVEIISLDKWCVKQEVKYIYLDTPLEELEKRYDIRGDEHITKEQLATIKSRYDAFYEQTNMQKMRLDTMKDGWLKEVEKFIGGTYEIL